MKNSLNISVAGEDLISTVDDSTNRLFINGSEIPSASWTGSGTYTDTIQGHAISITKVEDLDGNVAIRKIAAYTYELYKIKKDSGGGGGGGGEPNPPTLLWTNPNPSSGFSAQTVALSQDTASFDGFLIESKYAYDAGDNHVDFILNDGNIHTIFSAHETSAAQYIINWRNVTISGTSAAITRALYNSGAGGGNSTNQCIPLKIYGINFAGPQGPPGPAGGLDLLWTNASPTASFAAQTVPLDLSEYRAVMVEFKGDATSTADANRAKAYGFAFVGSDISWGGLMPETRSARLSIRYRMMTATTSGVTFGIGEYNASAIAAGTNTAIAIPLRIWGIK